MRDYFEYYGKLESFKLATCDRGHKGYGFIKYTSAKSTKECLNSSHFIHNRQIDVRYTKQSLQVRKLCLNYASGVEEFWAINGKGEVFTEKYLKSDLNTGNFLSRSCISLYQCFLSCIIRLRNTHTHKETFVLHS